MALFWNSIFLALLSVVITRPGPRQETKPGKQPMRAKERKVTKRVAGRLRNPQKAARKATPKAGVKKQSPVNSVYVFADDGTPLYSSLPASNNWTVWLEKGAELSVIEPSEEKMSRIKKQGYYIEVVDNQGNKGFVTAIAVKIKYS